MVIQESLTAQQRRQSQANYMRFCFLNGASYMCLGDTVLLLVAMHLQCPNAIISVLGNMTNLGYILLPLGWFRTGKVGSAQSMGEFWVYRCVAASLVAISLMIFHVNQWISWGLIILGSFLFYGFRAAGTVLAEPMMGNICEDNEISDVLGRSQSLFYISGTIALVIVSICLHFYDNSSTLAGIILGGIILGIVASVFMKRICETRAVMESVRKPFFAQLKNACRDSVLQRQIMARIIINIGYAIMLAVSIMALKQGFLFSDSQTVLFSLVQLFVSIWAARLFARFASRFGVKTTLLLGYLFVFPVCLFWIFIPKACAEAWMKVFFVVPFLLLGFFGVICGNALSSYFITSIPRERQAAYAVLSSLIYGILGSLFGMVIMSILLKVAEGIWGNGIPMFRGFFVLTAIIGVAGIPLMLALKKMRECHL